VPCQCRHTISQRTTNKNYATLHTVVWHMPWRADVLTL
jgi:hypothetical protein